MHVQAGVHNDVGTRCVLAEAAVRLAPKPSKCGFLVRALAHAIAAHGVLPVAVDYVLYKPRQCSVAAILRSWKGLREKAAHTLHVLVRRGIVTSDGKKGEVPVGGGGG